MKTGPLCCVFGSRKNGNLFIKKIQVWVSTRKGWCLRDVDSLPRSVTYRRKKEAKVWPWPYESELKLSLLKQAKFKAALAYKGYTLGPDPEVEEDHGEFNDEIENDCEIKYDYETNDEDDEV